MFRMFQVALLCLLLGSAHFFTVSRDILEKNAESSGNSPEEDDFSIFALLEKANKNLGKRPTDPVIKELDIAVGYGLQNADPCTANDCKWPKSAVGQVYVPYRISNQYTEDEARIIRSAVSPFAKSSCVEFVPHTLQKHFLDIVPKEGCYSHVGMQGGAQVVSLDKDKCMTNAIVQREMLHALGFHYEHSRSDRDEHVKIMWENIKPDDYSHFATFKTNNLKTPYDYGSVMQYGRKYLSKNGQPTIVPIPNANVEIGTAKEMSKNDLLRLNRLYC